MFMLRGLRKDRGFTMKELGEMVGVAESTISQYETEKREPDFETLLKFGEIFDVSVDYLLRGHVYSGETKKKPPAEAEGEKQELLAMVDSLTEEEAKRVLDYAELLLKAREAEQ